MSLYFWNFLGSGAGGLARFALSGIVAQRFGVTLEKVQVIHYRHENGARKTEGAGS